mgnify:CR=1 FL=1
MITSEDGYCPTCHEGDVYPTGYLDNIHFFKCNQCDEHYKFNIKKIELDQLPFTKPMNV